jgi:tRNA(Ile)-lysidine synthase
MTPRHLLVPAAAAPRFDGIIERCPFPQAGTRVTCAVSGGPDSTALAALAVAAGCTVAIVHVDHGLRAGSAAEVDVVRGTADRLGVTMRSVRVDLADGPNVEARARAARYAALPPEVLTGHTADDQAETVLLNLLRGASSGIAAMRPDARRPLLGLRRHETEWVCEVLGLEVVRDPSNTDRRFTRNRIRHDVLPLLCDVAGRDLVPVLTRQAGVVRDEGDLLDGLAAAIDPSDARALAAAPVPLARRAIRRWLTEVGDTGHPPDLATVERVLAVANGRAAACQIAGGSWVRRSRQRLSIEPESRSDPVSSPRMKGSVVG